MAEQRKRPDYRHMVYIHKGFQRGFILKFCLIALAAMAATTLLIYFFSRSGLTATYQYDQLSIRETASAILPVVIVANLVVLVGLLVATVFVTLYVSHRIGGPLFRFGKTLEQIGQGQLHLRLDLREGDQLFEFASQVNTMTEQLSDRIGQIRTQVSDLKGNLQRGEITPENLSAELGELEQSIQRLFRTE